MKKFGGSSRKKQRCDKRKCNHFDVLMLEDREEGGNDGATILDSTPPVGVTESMLLLDTVVQGNSVTIHVIM